MTVPGIYHIMELITLVDLVKLGWCLIVILSFRVIKLNMIKLYKEQLWIMFQVIVKKQLIPIGEISKWMMC